MEEQVGFDQTIFKLGQRVLQDESQESKQQYYIDEYYQKTLDILKDFNE